MDGSRVVLNGVVEHIEATIAVDVLADPDRNR